MCACGHDEGSHATEWDDTVITYCIQKDCPCRKWDPVACAPDKHRWRRERVGGPPDMAESLEVVEFCDECGMEKAGD